MSRNARPSSRRGLPFWGWALITIPVVIYALFVIIPVVAYESMTVVGRIMPSFVPAVNTTTAFYVSLREGNYSAAHGYLDSSLGAGNTEEALRNLWKSLSDDGTVDFGINYDLPFGIYSDRAEMGITLHAPGGTKSAELQLRKVNGQWKIHQASPSLVPLP